VLEFPHQVALSRHHDSSTVWLAKYIIADATLGNNLSSAQLTQLPIKGRGILPLLTLQAQVTPTGYVAGGRSDQSNVTLDGVDINEAETSDVGKPVLRLNSEAIEEFRVVTVNAKADEGRSSAAQINQPGDQERHEFVAWFIVRIPPQHDLHGERLLQQPQRSGTSKTPPQRVWRNPRRPIVKDKLFFFYSYEGRRDASGTAVRVWFLSPD